MEIPVKMPLRYFLIRFQNFIAKFKPMAYILVKEFIERH
jgi:hypothetical protein